MCIVINPIVAAARKKRDNVKAKNYDVRDSGIWSDGLAY